MSAYKPYVDDMINGDSDSSSSAGGGGSNTSYPTVSPSSYSPTIYQSSDYPTYSPSTQGPTDSPTTPYPTWSPIYHSIPPTLEPTINPTSPTMEPSDNPTTSFPSDAPIPSTDEPTYSPSMPTTEPDSDGWSDSETTTAEPDDGGFPMEVLYAFIFAFVAGLVFAWSKLLLPLINVLVRGSANKLERGRTFGVLSSIEGVCTYAAPLAIINLWESDYPIMAFIVCMILVLIGLIWLFLKIKQIILMNGRVPAFEEWNADGTAGRASYDANANDPRENRGINDNTHQDLFDL